MASHEMVSRAARLGLEERHFPFPYGPDSIVPVFQIGLIPIIVLAMMSLVSVIVLLAYITHRLVIRRTNHREFVGYNQYIILIYQLLLADLQQSAAFAISAYWLQIDKILGDTAPCFLQAWLLHIGDVSSGFFVLAIAIHTWLGVVKGYKMQYSWFVVSILFIWLAALVLTLIGPIIYGEDYFARAGGWCWVSAEYQEARLYFHYLWIFIVEFGTIAIYGHIFLHLRGCISSINNNNTAKLSRATKSMVMYPAIYVILTLPIAVGRMVAMAGVELPDIFFCFAGGLLTSCGWMDVLLYTLTRRVLNDDMITGNCARTVTDISSTPGYSGGTPDMDLESIRSKNHVSVITRSVTIIDGTDRLSLIADHRRGRSLVCPGQLERELSRDPSPAGSQDSVTMSMPMEGINIITETNMYARRSQ